MKLLWVLLFFSAPLVSQADDGAVQITVAPAKSYLLSGTASSCGDFSNFKMALAKTAQNSSQQTPVLAASVGPLRVSFPSFGLAWNGKLDLSVTIMRITIHSDQLVGGIYTYDLYDEELTALIGGPIATNPLKAGVMKSNDPGRDCDPVTSKNVMSGAECKAQAETFNANYAACGLDFGGVKLMDGAKAFIAPMTIELFGFTTDNAGKFNPSYSAVATTVEYTGRQ